MTKQFNFVATKAGVDENDDCLVATLDSGSDEYIMFQRTPEFGSPDDDGIYVEINSQIHASCDCVRACASTDTNLTLFLTSPLCGFTEIHVTLSVSSEGLHKFYSMLRRIFTGHESLLNLNLAGEPR